MSHRGDTRYSYLVLIAWLVLGASGLVQPALGQLEVSPNTLIRPAPPELCALLDLPERRAMMDGLLRNLAWSCGRQDEFLGHESSEDKATTEKRLTPIIPTPLNPISQQTDATVSDRTGEAPLASQSETTLAEDPVNGVLCSAFNDSWEFTSGAGGYVGFSRSTDGGATWQDGGAVGPTTFSDPSLIWRQADGNFYLSTLEAGGGLSIWVSSDGCQSFSFLSLVTNLTADDKEFLAVDNNPASPNYGNIYIVCTRLGGTIANILASRSINGGLTWSSPVNLFGVFGSQNLLQGAWPAVAPNGDIYVAWAAIFGFPGGNLSIQIARSTDGGLTYQLRTSPLNGAITPRDLAATSFCGRTALNGSLRILPAPQIAIDAQGNIHVVYSRDPDTVGAGDVIDVYYRRSSDGALNWGPEIRLNDDTTLNDQYHPTVQVRGNTVVATWNDRRRDLNNLNYGHFKRVSTDGGVTWFPNVRISNGTFGVVFDPAMSLCYHGDYDQSLITNNGSQVTQWSDTRAGDLDVYAESSNCINGGTSGRWKTPTTSAQILDGTLTGGQPGDPVLYSISGQAFPNGQLSGTLNGLVASYTPMTFVGSWKLDPSTPTPQGKWTAQLQSATTPGVVIGTITSGWKIPGPGTPGAGRHIGTWRICLQ